MSSSNHRVDTGPPRKSAFHVVASKALDGVRESFGDMMSYHLPGRILIAVGSVAIAVLIVARVLEGVGLVTFF